MIFSLMQDVPSHSLMDDRVPESIHAKSANEILLQSVR